MSYGVGFLQVTQTHIVQILQVDVVYAKYPSKYDSFKQGTVFIFNLPLHHFCQYIILENYPLNSKRLFKTPLHNLSSHQQTGKPQYASNPCLNVINATISKVLCETFAIHNRSSFEKY